MRPRRVILPLSRGISVVLLRPVSPADLVRTGVRGALDMSRREVEYPSRRVTHLVFRPKIDGGKARKGHVINQRPGFGRGSPSALFPLLPALVASAADHPERRRSATIRYIPSRFTATNPPGKADGKSPDFGIPPLESIDFRGQFIGTSPVDRNRRNFRSANAVSSR